MNRLVTLLAAVALGTAAQAQVVVTNDIQANTTWTSNNEYVLDGLVFVENGATLTIQAGTVVRGRSRGEISSGATDPSGGQDFSSALIVRRGSKIQAVGTADSPIIFTSTADDLDDDGDLDITQDRGLWGGVILLGSASTNTGSTDNDIEGIPTSEEAFYGGTNDADNSGTMSYVSIRYAGAQLGATEGNEINGLTMGGVGSGTQLSYIEIYGNQDDCFEWFGGTVSAKYLVGAYCGDDTFDMDEGFRGNLQFILSINAPDVSGRAAEIDNLGANFDATPLTSGIVSNATFIGSGVSTASAPIAPRQRRQRLPHPPAGGGVGQLLQLDLYRRHRLRGPLRQLGVEPDAGRLRRRRPAGERRADVQQQRVRSLGARGDDPGARPRLQRPPDGGADEPDRRQRRPGPRHPRRPRQHGRRQHGRRGGPVRPGAAGDEPAGLDVRVRHGLVLHPRSATSAPSSRARPRRGSTAGPRSRPRARCSRPTSSAPSPTGSR